MLGSEQDLCPCMTTLALWVTVTDHIQLLTTSWVTS